MTLTIKEVSHTYHGAREAALNSVSLTIPAGGVFGLLGPNGAGKTTLISLICGLIETDQGHITLDDEPLALVRTGDPARIALVPQDYAFYPMLSVVENLRFFGGTLGLSGNLLRQRCDAAIAFTRLEQVTGKLAETLSGGLRRRRVGETGPDEQHAHHEGEQRPQGPRPPTAVPASTRPAEHVFSNSSWDGRIPNPPRYPKQGDMTAPHRGS